MRKFWNGLNEYIKTALELDNSLLCALSFHRRKYSPVFSQNNKRYISSMLQERLLRNGTTTAAYFGTIHLEGSKILADVVHDKGQRALIGKVNMMRNCPEYYREMSVQDSIRDTEEFIRYVRGIQVSTGEGIEL